MASTNTAAGTVPPPVLYAARGHEFPRAGPDGGASRRPWLERVLVSMTLFALLATVLRITSRRLNQQYFWWDDWLALINMVCSPPSEFWSDWRLRTTISLTFGTFSQGWMLGLVALISTAVGLGLGLHLFSVDPANYVTMIKVVLVVDFFYIWSLVWSKTSVLCLYYRVFPFGYMKRMGCGMAALVVVWAIVSTVLLFHVCVPLRRLWDLNAGGHCHDATTFRLFNSVATIVTDLVILSLPLPQIWRLHLRTVEKVFATAVFGLGFL